VAGLQDYWATPRQRGRVADPAEFCTDPQRNPENRRSKYDGYFPSCVPPTFLCPPKDPSPNRYLSTVSGARHDALRHRQRNARLDRARVGRISATALHTGMLARIVRLSSRYHRRTVTASATRLGKTIHHLLAVSAGALRETVEAPVKIIDLFYVLPAVTNGWMFAAFVVAVFVWWIAPASRR